uniref:ATP-dependent DNA helicase RecG n=1 Tax=Agathobacter sp. TaxID=2021311 RepID=UPI0040573A39
MNNRNLNAPITAIKGVGEKTRVIFEKLNIYTIRDAIMDFPRSYMQYPEAKPLYAVKSLHEGMDAILITVKKSPAVKKTRNMDITILTDMAGNTPIQFVWFRMPYVKSSLLPGKQYVLYGKIALKKKIFTMEQPMIFEVEKYKELHGLLQPVYSLTAGMTNNMMIKTIKTALNENELIQDYLPAAVRKRYGLCEYNYALKQIHFPDSFETLVNARRCLVFHEFFLFIMGIQYQKEKQIKEANAFCFADTAFIAECVKKLPYELTSAQMRTLQDIQRDMKSPYAMHRLIQGDVGSGKTIIAFLAMAWCAKNGYQSAIMAPTEVLARQHYETFTELCERFGFNYPVVLLTGSMKQREKRNAYEKLECYPNALVVGTHALIQERAVYSNLSLVITDEQHRFGVRQRDAFAEKGHTPHILVMSATPIPRTLAIIIYGDMDISVIDRVPARRLPIKNCVVDIGYRPKACQFIIKQVELGHQAYVICPLVEETEHMEGTNATDYAQELAEVFPSHIKVGLLHGKMKNDRKNEVMEAFARNEIQVLVSTTVVEVGVNVPNATVMMIEDANRFGLAQLHQLRGRVGRGDAQSYCIMINTSDAKAAAKRLDILNKSNDGFFIASEDLKLRGPGDFFGVRQSGDLAFRIADIYQDANELQQAAESVKEILENDSELEKEEHMALRLEMQRFADEQMRKMSL